MLIENISNFSHSKIKKISKTKCKHIALNEYLSQYAISHSKAGIFQTYLLGEDKDNILGFISVSVSTVDVSEEINNITKISESFKYSLSALKITRLCIFEEYQRRGFGSILLIFAEVLSVLQQIKSGCKLLVVDSKLDAVEFYKENGFIQIKNESNENKDDTIFMIKPVITPNEFKAKEEKEKEEYINKINLFCDTFNLTKEYNEIKDYLTPSPQR